ncbi:MAG: FMN-binding negative transcriptional regulator [Pseudomonadota bacterium]
MPKPYPPEWRLEDRDEEAVAIMREYPFGHLITGGETPHATRIPFLVDVVEGSPVRLRAHLNAKNPQCDVLTQREVLVVFSGPYSYVSPNWRTNLDRGATYDYQEVRVRGLVNVEPDRQFFCDLVDDLSRQIEPAHAEIGDYPVWNTQMTPEGYIDRLHPHIVALSIDIDTVEMISKLHQTFSAEDRDSVAEHLARSHREESRKIASAIRKLEI